MLFMKSVDQFPEVYNCRWKLSNVSFIWVAFPQNKVIEALHLAAVVFLLAVNYAINDYFDFVFFVTSSLKFQVFFGL